jgi:predicted dehydrogenase
MFGIFTIKMSNTWFKNSKWFKILKQSLSRMAVQKHLGLKLVFKGPPELKKQSSPLSPCAEGPSQRLAVSKQDIQSCSAARHSVKVGVAGVGYLGMHHARIYAELEGCELVGVYDVDRQKAQALAQSYNCQAFDTLEALAEGCEAVSVVVPTDKHCEVAKVLLQKSCHLLIEKPLCTSLEEAEIILKEAEKHGCIVQVGHIENYNPVMQYLEEHVTQPVFITADRLASFKERGTEVGVVLDLMIHDIGVILKLVKSPVKDIEAVGVNVLSAQEDIVNARIRFENGCVANLNVSRVSFEPVRQIRIFQPFSYLSLNFMEQKGHILRKKGNTLEREELPIEKAEPLRLELDSFLSCVRQAREPKVGGEFGFKALELALRITDCLWRHNQSLSSKLR